MGEQLECACDAQGGEGGWRGSKDREVHREGAGRRRERGEKEERDRRQEGREGGGGEEKG